MEAVTTFCGETYRWCRSTIPTLAWPQSGVGVDQVGKKSVEAAAAEMRGPLVNQAAPCCWRHLPPNAGSTFVRLAGISGAAAVALGAYGAHAVSAENPDRKRAYETANFYHFFHTLALMAVPLTRRPRLSGSLMITGMVLFCGTIYYHALTGEKTLRRYTPFGGIILIVAWLSMAL